MSELQSTLIDTDLDYERFGEAWKALREMHGFTREELEEQTGLPPAWFELMEDCYVTLDFDHLDSLAGAYQCSPGELLDAMYVIAEAHTHDVRAEREELQLGIDFLEFLLKNRNFVTAAEFRRRFGEHVNEGLNALYDFGVRFKRHSTSRNSLPWAYEVEKYGCWKCRQPTEETAGLNCEHCGVEYDPERIIETMKVAYG